MIRLKPSVPLVWVGLCLATVSAEIGFLGRERARADRADAALEEKRQERDRLLRLTPAPSGESEKAIVTALDEATLTLAALRSELGGKQETVPVPDGAVAAFFALNRFAEEMRRRAADAQVAVKPAERFGFASYANEGPGAALLPAVHRQQVATAGVIAALLAARPLALLAVRREQSRVAGEGKPAQANDDYFTLPSDRSLRQPGLVEADAFRLEFTGQTAVLRGFLNALASAAQPMVVRTVEVEPFRETTSPPGQAGIDAGALRRPQVSKFAVTLEIPLIAGSETTP